MDIKDFFEGKKVWTMVGKRPVKMEVTGYYESRGYKNMFPVTYTLNLRDVHTRTLYSRLLPEVCETYEELRDLIFPLLEN